MNISENRVVYIHYTLTDDEGDELDSSAGQAPFAYIHGSRSIIPGLERALTGKNPGDELQVTIQPGDAYGEINPDLIQKVPREAFAGIEDLQPGMQFQTGRPDGQSLNITVRDVDDEAVTIDANHPLAGRVLHFDLRVEEVREANPEEIEHGHVHP